MVFATRNHRRNKSDPLVEEVQLIHANPQFTNVRFRDGREDTVSTRDLAPAGVPEGSESTPSATTPISQGDSVIGESAPQSPVSQSPSSQNLDHNAPEDAVSPSPVAADPPPERPADKLPVRKSTREVKPRVLLDLQFHSIISYQYFKYKQVHSFSGGECYGLNDILNITLS